MKIARGFMGFKVIFAGFTIALLGSCGLKYTPQVPPEEKQLERQQVIEATIKDEFAVRNMQYKSIGFGKTTTVKPVSFIKLDSLFEIKYNLEQQGRVDRALDEEIAVQRLICQNDTNEILYMEQHVFSLENDSIAEVFSGDFVMNGRNELKKVKFTESYTIPKSLVKYYNYYILEESFMGYNDPTKGELEFYRMYKTELANRSNKDAFLSHTLNLMEIARNKKSLEKQVFLEELTRQALHNGSKDYKSEFFLKIEQSVMTNGEVEFYFIDYQSEMMDTDKQYAVKKYSLTFDPFLVLLSKDLINRL